MEIKVLKGVDFNFYNFRYLLIECINKEKFNEIGHGGNEQFGAMSYKPGFAINPLKFLIGLAKAANEADVKIKNIIKIYK